MADTCDVKRTKNYSAWLKSTNPEAHAVWYKRKLELERLRSKSKPKRYKAIADAMKVGSISSISEEDRLWFEKKRSEKREYSKRHRDENLDKYREASRKSYHKHIEKRRARIKEYARLHPEGNRKRALAWQKRNRPKVAQNTARRKALLRKQTPESASLPIIQVFYSTAERVSKCLGIPHEVDHWIPLQKGGLHHQANLWIIPAFYNRRKNQRLLDSREDIFKLAA